MSAVHNDGNLRLTTSDDMCAQEPIHTPGSIQSHGALLALQPERRLRVVTASENAADFLGIDPIGQLLDGFVAPSLARELQGKFVDGELKPESPWEITFSLPSGRGGLEATIHAHGGLILIELERMRPDDAAHALVASRQLQHWIAQLRAADESIERLALVASQGIRQITGYERVLVYRFDPDWNGQAIAEDKIEDWAQSLNGLHFPASDIPRQARELYHHNLLRWVPTRDAAAVPLRVDPRHAPQAPIDLSFARLRSLSPIHLYYHRGMGVDGSMSLSILHDGRLWGLIVCHHRQPHYVSPGRRVAAAALTDAFALRLGPAARAQAEEARRVGIRRLSDLLAHMTETNDVMAAITTGPVAIETLFGATGAAAIYAGNMVTSGRTPSRRELLALASWLRKQPEQDLFHTDSLPTKYPAFMPHRATTSGLLAMFLSSDRADMLLWFRPEEPQLVHWGGDPRKPAADPLASALPRQSFERWVEIRRGHAQKWTDWELEMAGTLRHAMTEVIIRSFRRLAELNEQLHQSQKMEAVGQLTGGLAHDFNNLLTGIGGSLELLQIRIDQGRIRDLDRYVIMARNEVKRAAALTHRLLAFSRRQTLDPQPTDVNWLVAGMADLVRRTVGPAIEVELIAAIGLWPALVDPNQLENAILNLCINARDAMPAGGHLILETAHQMLDASAARERDVPPGQYVLLSVSDTGTGMPPEVMAKAFDPFFTTKPIGQGTGLGLSMIYGFVRQSGGQARIHSEVGQGTRICLYLPQVSGAAQPAEAIPELIETSREQKGETVLVVDDEATIRMLAMEVLEDLGYIAIEAADGPSGLKVLQSNARIDLLVTDVGLPGTMDGRQMVDAARVTRPDLKTLFITGYAENAIIGNAHLTPGMHMMTKPFTMQTFASRIKQLMTQDANE